jgi:hypothetical protein
MQFWGGICTCFQTRNGALNIIEELAETFKVQENQMFRANTGGWNPISMAAHHKNHEL